MSLNDNGRDRRAPASAAGASVAPTATSPMASSTHARCSRVLVRSITNDMCRSLPNAPGKSKGRAGNTSQHPVSRPWPVNTYYYRSSEFFPPEYHSVISIDLSKVSSPHRAKKVVSCKSERSARLAMLTRRSTTQLNQSVRNDLRLIPNIAYHCRSEISDSETESDIDTGFEETEAEEEDDEDDERDIPSSMSSDVRASTRRTIPPARNTCTDARYVFISSSGFMFVDFVQ